MCRWVERYGKIWTVEFACEDLPQNGVLLVPPASPDYDALLSEIERRAREPVDGAPPVPEKFRPRIAEEDRETSAILLNGSPKTIAAMQVVWRFETVTGRAYQHSQGVLSGQSLLLPFGRRDEMLRKLYGYWHSIFPGSKRYLSEAGMVGDNTDVRPPVVGEEWRGGIITGGTRSATTGGEAVQQVVMALDGIFFLDGEFIGPNREKLFERTVAEGEAHTMVGQIARDAHENGASTADILARVEQTTGPAPERLAMDLAFPHTSANADEFLRAALGRVAYQIAGGRKFPDALRDERAVEMVLSWTGVELPKFRRR